MTHGDYGALLDALRGVTWPSRAPSRGATAGTHVSRLRGASAEFTEYRAYRQGDDPKRLDWKLLARTDRAFLRITNERATHPTRFVLDASASMAFPDGVMSKWTQARRLLVGLATVAHAASDPVGAAAAGVMRQLPMRARRGVVADLARWADAIAPSGAAPLEKLVQSNTAARLVIITDLLGDADAMLRAAAQQHVRGTDLVLLHIVAREELDPPTDARLVVDPETPELQRPLGAGSRAAYREAFSAFRAEAARAWRAIGARYAEVVADEPAEIAVRRIVGSPSLEARA